MFRKDLMLVALITCIISLMIIPLSPGAIDTLLTLNMSLSIMLLMVGIYIKNPSDFSTFPSVILIGTAFRLSLSIGTTRLILTEGEGGDIIETFGNFVVGGSIAVGLVIFLIITVVQFLVVTKGAERVAEVAARFTLDALPGKQMAIDADIKAGTISAAEGDMLRRQLGRESQFFGAMDGAMKFVKGDAIAGLIIIVVNLLGGMVVGVMLHGMTFAESAHLFTLLTVGDGLVAQIPALLMAFCAGIIVTRATGPENADLGTDISRELLADPRVLGVAAVLVFAMGLIPGFPFWIFASAAGVLTMGAFVLRKSLRQRTKEEPLPVSATENEAQQAVSDTPLYHDRYLVLVGADLAEAVGIAEVQSLLQRQFDSLHAQSGVHFPCPAVQVDHRLPLRGLKISLDDLPLVSAELSLDGTYTTQSEDWLARHHITDPKAINLIGWSGYLVAPDQGDILRKQGSETLETIHVIVTAAFRLFERNIAELFGRKEFDSLVRSLELADKQVMAAVAQASSQTVLYRVMRALVSDGVPLRPASIVVEALHYWTQMPEVSGVQLLEDCLRGSLKRQICHALSDQDGTLGVVMLYPDYEDWLRTLRSDGRRGAAADTIVLPAEWAEPVLRQFRTVVEARSSQKRTIAIVVAADLRRSLRSLLAANDIQSAVLAPHELAKETRCIPLDVLHQPRWTDNQPTSFEGKQVA